MSAPLPTTPAVRFHVSLNVSDLAAAVAFYRVLFDRPPAKERPDYAKFEPDEPPLVLSLEPSGLAGAGGPLNHLGIRLADSRALVAVQERLERHGIRSQREEGVECCYARQTKFWVTDPDGTMWEFYTLDADDLEHRGDASAGTAAAGATTWEHWLGRPIPARIDAADGSLDECRLRGSFNVPMSGEDQTRLMAEAARVLKPGGRVLLHMLTGDRPVENPGLPGIAAPVTFVPAKDEMVALVAAAGLTANVLKYDGMPAFHVRGATVRETQIEGRK